MKIVKRLSIKRHAFKGYSQSVDAVLNESAPHLRAVAPRDPRRIIVAARGRHCYFSLLRAMHTCSEQGASTKGGTALHFATCTGALQLLVSQQIGGSFGRGWALPGLLEAAEDRPRRWTGWRSLGWSCGTGGNEQAVRSMPRKR